MVPRRSFSSLPLLLLLLSAPLVFGEEDPLSAQDQEGSADENLIDSDSPWRLASADELQVENLTLVERGANLLRLSWDVSGAASGEQHCFALQLFREGQPPRNFTTPKRHYSLTNLSACCAYKIAVAPARCSDSLLVDAARSRSIEAETSFRAPGQVSDLRIAPSKAASLQVSWSSSEQWSRCVHHYRLALDSSSGPSSSATTNSTSHTFDELHACTSYSVTVTPVDIELKDGPPSSDRSPPTLKEVMGAPKPLETPQVSSNSSTLSWLLEDKRNNCSLRGLESECRYEGTDGWGYELCNSSASLGASGSGLRPQRLSTLLRQLSPYTRYACRARAVNEQGPGDWSDDVRLLTAEDRPSAPQRFQSIGRLADNRLAFGWAAPKYKPGRLLDYRINFTWSPSYPVPRDCSLERTYLMGDIDPRRDSASLDREEACAHYSARISARTGAGHGPEVEIEFDAMSGGRPGRVTHLQCTWKRLQGDPRALDTTLEWRLPCASRGLLYQFRVEVTGNRAAHDNHSLSALVDVPGDYDSEAQFSVRFGELRALYRYQFRVVATIRGGAGEPGDTADCYLDYPAGIPPQPDAEYVKSIRLDPQKARRSTSSAAILLPLFPEDNGPVKYYAVMVSARPFANTSLRFELRNERWPNVSSWEEAYERDFEIVYQATEPMWQPSASHVVDYGHMRAVKFVIGEDATCPEVSSNTETRAYCNGPLRADTWYEVRMRAFTEHGYSDSVAFSIKTNAELNVTLLLGVVFAVLLLGILTTLMLLVKRCSFRLLLQRIAQSNIPESPVPNPLTRRKFLSHCQQLLENPSKLSNEFQLLHTLSIDLQMPSNAACLQANRKKNRYSDILPYDFSRVKLEIIDNDPNTDYINASFIRGYSCNEEYIACQGPKEETSHDFWRMVEQYDVKMIVMLTQLVERGREKCHQYFPAIREIAHYDKLAIKCTSELDYRTYTQRTLLLQKDDKRRTITHLHFKDWPDHDVPDDFDAMIQFCQMFRKQMNSLKGLSVVHCSAGIGRTGTLIAIDILLQCIRDNRKLDVFGTVYRLRRHRLNMVQRESQYAYIYNCIRQVLKNPYFLKSYKPPPIDPIYSKAKSKKRDKCGDDPSADIVDSLDTLRKYSLSASMDSLQPLCQSSPRAAPKIPMNVLFAGLRYCKSTSAIDTKSHHNRLAKYNSEGYAICASAMDCPSSCSSSTDEINEMISSCDSMYDNAEPLIGTNSSQTMPASDDYLTNDVDEKDTSL